MGRGFCSTTQNFQFEIIWRKKKKNLKQFEAPPHPRPFFWFLSGTFRDTLYLQYLQTVHGEQFVFFNECFVKQNLFDHLFLQVCQVTKKLRRAVRQQSLHCRRFSLLSMCWICWACRFVSFTVWINNNFRCLPYSLSADIGTDKGAQSEPKTSVSVLIGYNTSHLNWLVRDMENV